MMLQSKQLVRNPPKPKKKPVTVIVGIICKEAIILASDSQTTYGTTKRCDAEKMVSVTHPTDLLLTGNRQREFLKTFESQIQKSLVC